MHLIKMFERIKNDFVGALLAWFIALLLPVFALWFSLGGRDEMVFFFVVHTVSCLLLLVYPFAHEYEHKTWRLLFSQPISRERVWFEKLLASVLLSGSIVALYIPVYWIQERESYLYWLFPAWIFFCVVAPVVSLLTRSYFLTLFALMAYGLGLLLYVYNVNWMQEMGVTRLYVLFCILVVSVFAAVFAHWAAFKLFLQFEPHVAASYRLGCPQVLLHWVKRLPLEQWGVQRAYAALVRKEFLMFKEIVTFALISYALLASALLLMGPLNYSPGWLKVLYWTLIISCLIGVPLILGAYSLSYEKQCQLTFWQMSLPISLNSQWYIKLLVVYSVNFVLSLCIPGCFAYAALSWFNPSELEPFFKNGMIIAFANVVILSVALLCGSLTQSTSRSLWLALVSVLLSLIIAPIFILFLLYAWNGFQGVELKPVHQSSWIGFALSVICVSIFYAYSYWNYLSPMVSRIRMVWQLITAVSFASIWWAFAMDFYG